MKGATMARRVKRTSKGRFVKGTAKPRRKKRGGRRRKR
jgi:hypothetical protein